MRLRGFGERNFHGIRGRLLLGMVSIVASFSIIGTAVSVYFMHEHALQSFEIMSNDMSDYFVRHLSLLWTQSDRGALLAGAREIFAANQVNGGSLYDAEFTPLLTRRKIDFGPQPGLDSLRLSLRARPRVAMYVVRDRQFVKRAMVHVRPVYEFPTPRAMDDVRAQDQGKLFGFLEIIYDLEFARAQRLSIYKINGSLLMIFVVLGSLLAYAFSRQINRPLSQLVAGVEKIGAGNLGHRVNSDGVGELPRLGRAFNAMADELQQRTEALQRSEARHRLLIANAQDGIFVIDSRLRFVEVNDKFCELAGLPQDELLGSPMSDIIIGSRENPHDIVELFDRRYFHREVQLQRRDDRRVFIDLNASPLAGDLYMGIARDITEKQRFERELRRAAELRDLLLRTISDGLVVVNLDAEIVMVNHAAEAILEGRAEALRHKTLMQCGWDMQTHDGRYLEFSRHPVIRALHGRERVVEYEMRIRRPDREKILQVNAAPLLDDRKTLLGAVATLRDVTHAKQNEQGNALLQQQIQQRERLASLGEMAAGVAHEINNPVTGVINYAHLLLGRDLGNDDDRLLLRGIFDEGNRIAEIVHNLLAFARQDKQEHTATRLDEVLDASLSLVGRSLQQDGITILRELPQDLPSLYCRGPQIQQVFIHLMNNARDALNRRYPGAHENKILRIAAGVVERDDHTFVRTEFIDHGVGIAPEILPRIFDPFFTTKDLHQGMGLGLSVTYGIVKDHQGDIHVESVPGEKTTFAVELPAANGIV